MKRGADINRLTDHHLSMIAEHGDAQELKVLLRYGLDANIQVKNIPLMLHCLSKCRDDLFLEFVNAGDDVFYINEYGSNYLHNVRDSKVAEILISKGFDVNALNKSNRAPIQSTSSSKVAELLSDNGADIGRLNQFSNNALSSVKLMLRLINEQNINLDAYDDEGETIIHKLVYWMVILKH